MIMSAQKYSIAFVLSVVAATMPTSCSFAVIPSPTGTHGYPLNPCHTLTKCPPPPTNPLVLFAENQDDSDDGSEPKSALEQELEDLQNQLALIEAMEERNKSQLESFIDAQDQWDSMEEEERQFLLQKDSIVQRMEEIAEDLVKIWMGAKSMDG